MKANHQFATLLLTTAAAWIPLATETPLVPRALAEDRPSSSLAPPDLWAEPPVRNWASKNGNSGRLRLVLVQGSHAVFVKDDIHQVSVPLDSLADDDREMALAFADSLETLKTPVSEGDAPAGGKLVQIDLEEELPHQPRLEGRAVTVGDHIWKAFHAYYNGRLYMVESYDGRGRLHGPKILYFPNGHIFRIYYFNNGAAEGRSYRFTQDGVIHESIVYRNSRQMGMHSYYKTGELRNFYPLVAGVRQGYSEHYFRSGDLYARQYWVQNEQRGVEEHLTMTPRRLREITEHGKSTPLGTLWGSQLGDLPNPSPSSSPSSHASDIVGAPRAETAQRSLINGEFRKWTNKDGRSIEAALRAVSGDKAELTLKDGRTFTVSLSDLSSRDRRLARRLAE